MPTKGMSVWWSEPLRVLWLVFPVMLAEGVHIIVIKKDWLAFLKYFDYGETNLLAGGALLGLGFVLGELSNSCLKRRRGCGSRLWAAESIWRSTRCSFYSG